MSRFGKLLGVLRDPRYWSAAVRGVFPTLEHAAVLSYLRPATLIDVGANKGQFSLLTRRIIPSVHIEAFEPLIEARRQFEAVIGAPYRLHPYALGTHSGVATFHVTDRADSSSLLRPGSGQHEAYDVALASKREVEVRPMVDLVDLAGLPSPVFMKIDVQGAELAVLQGLGAQLRHIDHIYCECSFVELYEGQPMAEAIIGYLLVNGFSLRGVMNTSLTKSFGPTQADFLFSRVAGATSAD